MAKLWQQLAQNLRVIKLERFLGSLWFSYQRDRLERQFEQSVVPPLQSIGEVEQVSATPGGAQVKLANATLEVTFLADDLVRLDWQPGHLPVPYGIMQQEWPEVEPVLQEHPTGWSVTSAALQIQIDPGGRLEFQDSTGQILTEMLSPYRQGESWTQRSQLQPEEHIYGLGGRAAPLNLRQPERTYRLWNYDAGGRYGPGTDPLYLCIPVYMGLHAAGSYLVFYENTFEGTLNFAEQATVNFAGGALRYYVVAGSPAHLLERYTQLTGRPPLPPRWALGYHQSRWGYGTATAVRQTAAAFQAHDIPISAIHLDIDCLDGFRAFTINPTGFPDPQALCQELAARDIRLVTIINPGVKADRQSKLFEEGRLQKIFCTLPDGQPVIATVWPGRCAFPDFTNPLARHWWSRQYEYLLDLGIAGFWHDMNEPGVFTLWEDASLPRLATQHDLEGRGGNHQEAHNVYGLMQAEAGFQSLAAYRPQQRPFIVSRSGWAGLQRYAWTWTGDVETSWQGLQQTIPTVLGLSLSGIPYSGPDIGGFKGNPSAELYLRWFQLAAFLTFCRTHSANNVKHRTPWLFGEPTLSCVRQLLQLRYQLLPYFYTLAWQATQTGEPPVRPLFWLDPQDKRLWSVEDAFLLGALLVCPVVQEGVRSRAVILPSGHWYNFWDDTLLQGPATVELAAPLEQMPVLVRAGTVLPLEQGKRLILHLYPPVTGGERESYLYSDAGDGYGPSRVDRFRVRQQDNQVTLTRQRTGEFSLPYTEVLMHCHRAVEQAWVDGCQIAQPEQQISVGEFQQVVLQLATYQTLDQPTHES